MKKYWIAIAGLSLLGYSCKENKPVTEPVEAEITTDTKADSMMNVEEDYQPKDDEYFSEQFADLKIIRYYVPGWNKLDLKQKKLLYYLYEAALSGRDIIWDQNYKYNLTIRNILENIVVNYNGDKSSEDWNNFMTYTKRVWFSNGIHHHYSNNKFIPKFSFEYLQELVKNSPNAEFALAEGQTIDDLLSTLKPIMFDPKVDAKKVSLDSDKDLVTSSAVNFYDNVTGEEVSEYYKSIMNPDDKNPISYGLNSHVTKKDGKIVEEVWKVDGMYGEAISKIVYWLEKAEKAAENEQQRESLELLVEYYKTGDLKVWDDYNIAWVADTASVVDVINGFIEVYNDPNGYKGSFESVVSIKDFDASERMKKVAANAQYFEDNSTIMDAHKKKNVKGVSYKVINVVMESGDASPSTPIGINLPNANWIRAEHGSKSVSLGNITLAYEKAGGKGMLTEFAYDQEEIERAEKYGTLSGKLHTALHEVIGHASGQLNKGVGTPKETLKNYSSTLEEGRADLVALYYMMDPKLVEMGLIPSLEVGKAEYDSYIRNGLMAQLRRIEPGENIEEAHMRNRQFVAKWVFEKGAADNVIEKVVRDGKTYFNINDYEKLRVLFGQLLREVQTIKSEGDFEAGKALVENYGVKVDQDLHKEVLERAAKLNIAPYGGFINPKLVAITDAEGNITDVKIEYPESFEEQMLEYGKTHAYLPVNN